MKNEVLMESNLFNSSFQYGCSLNELFYIQLYIFRREFHKRNSEKRLKNICRLLSTFTSSLWASADHLVSPHSFPRGMRRFDPYYCHFFKNSLLMCKPF